MLGSFLRGNLMGSKLDKFILNKMIQDVFDRHRNIMGILGELATDYSHHTGGEVRLNSRVWSLMNDSINSNLGLITVIGNSDSRVDQWESLTKEILAMVINDFRPKKNLFGELYMISEDIFCKKYLEFVVRTHSIFAKDLATKTNCLHRL
jgi:hypothetical protein